MKDKKIKISKKEFYDNGGFSNSNLFRKQIGKTNGWSYYKLVTEQKNMKTLQSILNEVGDMSDWKQEFENTLSTLQKLTQKLNQVRYADEIRNNKELSNMILHEVVNKMDSAYHSGAEILDKIKFGR